MQFFYAGFPTLCRIDTFRECDKMWEPSVHYIQKYILAKDSLDCFDEPSVPEISEFSIPSNKTGPLFTGETQSRLCFSTRI